MSEVSFVPQYSRQGVEWVDLDNGKNDLSPLTEAEAVAVVESWRPGTENPETHFQVIRREVTETTVREWNKPDSPAG
jgi:hypothetical protein